MHSKICSTALYALAALVPYVAAHGAIINAVGDASSVQGAALGVDPSTPRDGTRRRPFQQDTTIFEEKADELATAQGCGQTLGGGPNNISGDMAQMAAAGAIPQVSAGGQLTMTLHQVNADGAGPYVCMIDMTGTGQSFQPLQVTTQVPGERGRERDGQTTGHPLVVAMPANMQCTGSAGGAQNLCMVRCQNPARAGPFGGCVPVQQMGGNNAQAAQVANPNVNTGNNGAQNNNQNNQVSDNLNGGNNGASNVNGGNNGGNNGASNVNGGNNGGNNGATNNVNVNNRNQKSKRATRILTDADFAEEDAEDAAEDAAIAAKSKSKSPSKATRRFRFHRH